MIDDLQQKVDRALDIAVFENGYVELMTDSPDVVAVDLCNYDQECELEEPDNVARCVRDYQLWCRTNL